MGATLNSVAKVLPPIQKDFPLRHLRTISILMAVAGIVAIVASLLLDLGATVTLVGMMLVVAGAVKIVIIGLWHGVAGFGVPITADAPSPTEPRKERRR
jgi:hypothetical protein